MSTELIKLILGIVGSGVAWTTWLAVGILIACVGTIMVWREHARRQTYREILNAIHPGTYLSDQTQSRSRLTVVRLPEQAPRVAALRQVVEGEQKRSEQTRGRLCETISKV